MEMNNNIAGVTGTWSLSENRTCIHPLTGPHVREYLISLSYQGHWLQMVNKRTVLLSSYSHNGDNRDENSC